MFSEIYCVVQGKVQGVGYRDFVESLAREHSLSGWVKNQSNGSVELVLQGIPDTLRLCIERLHQGSPLAQIESIAVDWRTPKNQLEEFKVIAS